MYRSDCTNCYKSDVCMKTAEYSRFIAELKAEFGKKAKKLSIVTRAYCENYRGNYVWCMKDV